MFATGDYNRFYHDIVKQYSDMDIPITYGILIADYNQTESREYILNYLSLFNDHSNEKFDFFIPGYTDYNFGENGNNKIKIGDKNFYFDNNLFVDFLDKICNLFNFQYTYNPMLILLEKKPNCPPSSNDKKIIIELDESKYGVRRAGLLFDEIFEIASSEISINNFSDRLNRTYVKKHILDEIVNALDNKLISLLYKTNNMRRYKIK